jgi:hypothetical protein
VAKHSVNTIVGTRSIIIVDIHQVGTSCGFSVPFYDFVGFRDTLNEHFRKKDEKFKAGNTNESMDRYWAFKNAWSMDGLPGMKRAVDCGKKEKVEPIKKMVGPFAPTKCHKGNVIATEYVILVAFLSFLLGAVTVVYGKDMAPFWDVNRMLVGGLVNVTGKLGTDILPRLEEQMRRR